MKNEKGITLISLVITIIVMAIISSAMIYNSRNNVYINQINELYADIQTLNREVDAYYVKYGELPVLCEFKTATVDNSSEDNKNNLKNYLTSIATASNAGFRENATVVNPNDGNEYYVIDLNKLEGISLNYGYSDNYEQVKQNGQTTISEQQSEKDLYIINGLTHQIYYLAGVVSDGTMYNSYDVEKSSTAVEQPEEWLQPNGLFRTAGSVPYLPTGFSGSNIQGERHLSEGLVVKDSKENEYVWIPVPNDGTGPDYTVAKTKELYSDEFFTEVYKALQAYVNTTASEIRTGSDWQDVAFSSFTDDWSSYTGSTTTAIGVSDFNTLKNKILKSIYDNGGFYVGRYETGYTSGDIRTASNKNNTTNIAVIKQGAKPYNYVTYSLAQGIATTFGTTDYNSTLMLGIQWDLILKFIKDKTGKSLADSTTWGNYNNDSLTVTQNVTSTTGANDTWTRELKVGYQTNNGLLPTGVTGHTNPVNIYDIAGNVYEWTLEYSSNSSYPCTTRGGSFSSTGSDRPARNRGSSATSASYRNGRF